MIDNFLKHMNRPFLALVVKSKDIETQKDLDTNNYVIITNGAAYLIAFLVYFGNDIFNMVLSLWN